MRVSEVAAAAVAASTAGILTLTLMAPPAVAAPSVTVAPSPNGLVMAGVPTTITPTGFAGKAKLFVNNPSSGGWDPLGTVTSGKAVAYTFPSFGRIRVNIVLKGKPAMTTTVPVYGRFVSATDPWTFGDMQLPVGRPTSALSTPVTMPASAGCAQVDLGLEVRASSDQSSSGTLVVRSTGAPEARLSVQDGAAVLLAVPVSGAVTVSLVDYVNPDYNASRVGVVWYCSGRLQLPQVPS